MYNLPTHISRYEIKSRIGRGGMGDLYLALDPNTGRLVALKLLNATLDSIELRERFAREARALAALNHPNIVNIYDTGEFDDSPFIVMEYVRGETLAELIKRRAPLSVPQKLRLIEDLCAGLGQAHEAGIIHRDIKPANLMVDQQGRLKILDFGIARVAEGNKTRVGPLTQVNMMIGTPGYMSPEQIEGGEVDHRSDIFAVGAVCYELLSYDEAFTGNNTRQIEMQVLRGQPKPLATLGLDPEIDEIVLRALKRDPNKRYQDAATFERALARLRSRLGPDTGPQHRLTPPPPQNQRGMSREVRAEAAYQRALLSYGGGSADAARRSAVEAIAEDPSHVGARELLARLDHRGAPLSPLRPVPGAPTAVATSAESAGTLASSATVASSGTIVSGSTMASSETRASAPAASPRAVSASAPTIVITPPASRPPGVAERFQGIVDKLRSSAGTRAEARPRGRAAWEAQQPIWQRYPRAIVAAAAVVAVAAIAALVMLIVWRPSGQLLTITRPVGGTLSAAGINCGTRGNDCATNFKRGELVELRPEADAGYVFVGYTGPCAPAGRVTMSDARTCGANFELAQLPATTAAATQVLTISPVPTGGTLEGVDIVCGTKGSACTANVPEKQMAELRPSADPGFTFTGFLGDCTTGGQVQMNGPRTCSAKFTPTAIAEAQPVLPPRRSGAGGGRGPAPIDKGPAPVPVDPPSARGPAPQGRQYDAPSPGRGAAPPQAGEKPDVVRPPTDDEDAKTRIQSQLSEWCAAFEALDPDRVQRVYPKVDINALRRQLNHSKYKSVQCKFGEPKFVAVDGAAGKVQLEADLTRVYDHTVTGPEKSEQIATMTFTRANRQSPWFMDSINYRQKPKS
jgi:serine/threonine protein kinase